MSAPGILLVRHGQSAWNAVRRWQGSADIELTELGRAQASALGRALAGGEPPTVTFSQVWSSDLRRASVTAAIIAAHLGVADVRTDPRLREAHAGGWQGLTVDEIERGWPGYLADHRRPHDFERAESVVARAADACTDVLDGLDRTDGMHVIAVTHSGVIRALCRHLGAVDERVPNLGGVWVHRADDGLCLGGRLIPLDLPVDASLDASVGLDGPGEDPGDETDDADGDGGAERGAAR